MSEFYIKSANPSIQTKNDNEKPEQAIQVNISSFKYRSNLGLTAEHDGKIIGSVKFNITTGDNIIDLPIEYSAEPRKISVKLIYRQSPAHSIEVDITPSEH